MIRSRAILAVTAAVAASVAAAPAARAQEVPPRTWELDLTVPLGGFGGHTTYRTDFSDPTGAGTSQLEFPLDAPAVGVRARATIRREGRPDRFAFQVAFLSSFASGKGTLKDSDWISDSIDVQMVGSAHPGLDIYSESDTSLDAKIFEGRAVWELSVAPGLGISPMIGVQWQRFQLTASNVRQIGYGPYAAQFTGNVPGPGIDYQVAYLAPYAGAEAKYERGAFALAADLWVSPFASAEDRDDHLLRGRLATTSATGAAWQASLGARFSFAGSDAVQLEGSYVGYSVSGSQHVTMYAGPDAGQGGYVHAKLTSGRATVLVAYTHHM